MSTLCIVPCGHRKVWDKKPDAGPTQARYVYTGPFASKCREYAERFYPRSWYILSAKFGFMSPDFVIGGPYNVTFKAKKTNPISMEVLSAQVITLGLNRFEKILALGGKGYVEIVGKAFRGREIINPLSGCKGNGIMMGRLERAIRSGIPLGSS
jgi:hypothetical protein